MGRLGDGSASRGRKRSGKKRARARAVDTPATGPVAPPHVANVFDQWDTEASGRIDQGEWRQLIAEVCPQFKPRDIDRLCAAAGINGNDTAVDYRRFLQWLFQGSAEL